MNLQKRTCLIHVQVPFRAPVLRRHVPEPCADQHQGRLSIRKAAYHTGPATDLTVEAFQDVVRPDAAPVFMREVKVGQRFHDPVVVRIGLVEDGGEGGPLGTRGRADAGR